MFSRFSIFILNIIISIYFTKDPLKIPKVSDTRWLSIEGTVSRILNQWIELKLHFTLAAGKEKCHKAQILSQMYNDSIIYLYLLFLRPVLFDMQRINKSFQSKNANSTKLLQDLALTITSLQSKIIPTDVTVDILQDDFESFVRDDLYLGYEFEKEVTKLKLDNATEKEVRANCTNFIKKLVQQLKLR